MKISIIKAYPKNAKIHDKKQIALIAAEKTGRICYGMEISPKYVDNCIARWEEYTKQKAKKI